MGDFKLKINVARFAAENNGGYADQPAKKYETRNTGNKAFTGGNINNLRDVRSYREVVGHSNSFGSSSKHAGTEEDFRGSEKSIVVPDKTGAFNDLFGTALVGRTVDLETLVDFDKLLRIAKISVANLQYLGGLSLLISFSDVESARMFMEDKKVWGPWFSKLDFWSGQTLPLERVAWLKLCGIPLHLLDPVVLGMIGESFGKLLHVPKLHEEDLDLSMVRVGVLVGNPGRIKEMVSLRWKDKVFRIWVEEDSDVWVPDSVEKDVDTDGVEILSPEVSPGDDSGSGSGEMEGLQSSEFEMPAEESPINVGAGSHSCMSPRYEEREKVAADFFENVENLSGNDVPSRLGPSLVGPGGNGGFEVGVGGNKRGPIRRRMLGQNSTKAQSSGPKEAASVVERPKKRPRSLEKEEEPGFGFVGFTSSPRVHLDLNVSAQAKDQQADVSRPEDNQVGQSSRDRVSTAEEEINATIEIGAQVGMEFGQMSDQALNILGSTVVTAEDVMGFWGSKNFEFDFVGSVGLSGGLVCVWDSSVFRVMNVIKNRNYMCLCGNLVGRGENLNIVNVYAPQSVLAKQILWNELSQVISNSDGLWMATGDFNAVRYREEKRNCGFKQTCANNFNSFVFESGLIEYSMSGWKFTYESSNGKKLSKLDRFLVNMGFFNVWPDAKVEAVPTFLSDHRPIILKTSLVNFGPRPFRLFDSWFDRPGFQETVVSALGKDPGCVGPPDVRLVRRLGILRADLKIWRDEMLKKESESVSLAQSDLEHIQSVMEVRDLSEEEEWTLLECKKVLKEEEERKSSDMRQRSRIKWAKDGDENSRYFHTMINCRKASNSIHGLDVNGVWVSKPSLVKKEVFRFFRSKFVEECVARPRLVCSDLKRVSESDASMLDARFSVEEIKAAVFGCGDDRAPGPDGVNFRFVKRFWNLLEADFVDIMEEFYSTGAINPGCGSSFIALIPKVNDPIGLNDFRPISLVGLVNKVISKVLANRLKKVLDKVISFSQSAFIGGRLILDGPLIVNEILNWAKKSKDKLFFLKIDFEKAYDNINWNFIIDLLSQMGFSDKWKNWIKGVVSSASASVLVNGAPTFEFKCFKGMRQGDPLSPFLFVIVMEALSCMIRKACNLEIIKGVCLPNDGPVVSHLFYADDAVILGEWCRSNITNVVRILRCFHLCSGLKINLLKSNLYGVGIRPNEVNDMAGVIGCSADAFPFKFLGLNVGANMNRVENWRPVFDSLEKRLTLWKASLLSIGGRVTLIRSVLESLPNYYFSLYRAPAKVVKDLEALIRKFLWGGSSEVKKVHWVAWDRVASPLDSGGLGLQRLSDVNVAFLSKWGWRYKNEQDSLWVKVVNAFHVGGSAWDFLPLKKSLGGVWNNIVSVFRRPVIGNLSLRKFFKGEVKSGNKILFWLDPWLDDVPLKEKFPNLFKLEMVKTCSVRDRLDGEGLWLWRHDPETSQELSEWQVLSAALGSVSLASGEDRWSWLGNGSKNFSVAAVKYLISSSRDYSSRYVMDWCKWVPKKCNIFAWRADLNRIPTCDALGRRGMLVINDMCSLCGEDLETVSHIFSACPFSLSVWEKVSLWCRIPRFFVFSFRDLIEIHNVGDNRKAVREALQGIVLTTCWLLWKARNNVRFNGIRSSVEDIFCEVRIVSFFWYKYRAKKGDFEWGDWCKFVSM
ncbi:putative RNA-directed DNA polymerase [Helianthus annuus]|uniref:RNA-directed DNA polymerase n=1 Tax=Helianthus annuus TaxID=4232 RepID=A0A9K3EHG4_HELAN|nr:putative RNA-directed DNA polymerase [Helianthus annuus]KAJ0481463.1 putative RNA-directed DNA polymerase [Helianthus annuus]KAJ0497916.1 putative RNA-directed DNA polymerase [Helianthus annuus]KAJ0663923.1 putative RNA-directed DNA polymerase [Helianthus annuus]KAJ0671410.1 putative RNA-directed DNA polymerase [Helianthus annuus]